MARLWWGAGVIPSPHHAAEHPTNNGEKMLQILFYCPLSLINPLMCSSHFIPVLTVCLLYFCHPHKDKNPSESCLAGQGGAPACWHQWSTTEDQGNKSVVTTADSGRGGAGNQFLPGPRLVPSYLGIPKCNERYPKKICPLVWLCSSCSGHVLNALEWREAFLFTPLSHCRQIC